MPNCILKNGRVLNEKEKPYIVAEVNSSHNGNINSAKEMINEAKEIGCDCVKFQSWSADSLYSRSFYKENPISERIVKKFSFTLEEQFEIASYCHEVGIDFASTPYSKEEVTFLIEKCNVPFIKVASMEVNNYPYLKYIASTGVPIVMSIGMADMHEIHKAVSTIYETGNKNLCILHCVSSYPAEMQELNLRNITMLRREFPECPIGYSDHSIGIEATTAAVALGAVLIEKHFTLDNSKIGMDNQMATEPQQFRQLVQSVNFVFEALGSDERNLQQAEIEQRAKMRRSIIVTKDMHAGDIINLEVLDAKRPGSGIEPGRITEVIGRSLKVDKMADTLLLESDLI